MQQKMEKGDTEMQQTNINDVNAWRIHENSKHSTIDV